MDDGHGGGGMRDDPYARETILYTRSNILQENLTVLFPPQTSTVLVYNPAAQVTASYDRRHRFDSFAHKSDDPGNGLTSTIMDHESDTKAARSHIRMIPCVSVSQHLAAGANGADGNI